MKAITGTAMRSGLTALALLLAAGIVKADDTAPPTDDTVAGDEDPGADDGGAGDDSDGWIGDDTGDDAGGGWEEELPPEDDDWVLVDPIVNDCGDDCIYTTLPVEWEPGDEPAWLVDPIPEDCGEDCVFTIMPVEGEEGWVEITVVTDEGEVTGDDGTTDGDDPIRVTDYPDSDCGGCEYHALPTMADNGADPRGLIARTEESNPAAHPQVMRAPNICTTPELYVAWLCAWQGFDAP